MGLTVGRFDQLVTVQKSTVTRDPNTNQKKRTYSDVGTFWAKITPVRSRERFLASRELGVLSYRFEIRAFRLEGADHEWRILWDGKIYDILGIAKKGRRKRESIEFLCEVKE